jgi:hypothetical protein
MVLLLRLLALQLLDRGTGISMVFVTQVLPDDPDTKELWKALEREVYALVAKRG